MEDQDFQISNCTMAVANKMKDLKKHIVQFIYESKSQKNRKKKVIKKYYWPYPQIYFLFYYNPIKKPNRLTVNKSIKR